MSEHVHPNAGAPLTNAQADDQRHPLLADDDNPSVAEYPRLFNRSARFIFRAVPRAERPIASEYVGVDRSRLRSRESRLAVSQWNMLWEAAQFRRYIALDPGLPESLQRLVDRENTNVVLVPRSESRYWEYAPLLHLLPAPELHRFGLPVLASPHWPFLVGAMEVDEVLPADFGVRLGRAWASRVWRDLCSGSPEGAFTRNDPVRLLAHNLDFWLPPVTEVIHDLLRELPAEDSPLLCGEPLELDDGTPLEGVTLGIPRGGRDLWRGTTEAAQVVRRVVERADADGRLRVFRELGGRYGEGMALTNLGLALRQVRRFDEAVTAQQQAAEIFRELGDRHGEGTALTNLGLGLWQVRRFDEAVTAHQQAGEIFREQGSRYGEGTALTNLGSALWQVRRFDEAITAQQQAAEIFRELGDRHCEGMALATLGLALQQVRRFDQAQIAWERATEAFAAAGATGEATTVNEWLAELAEGSRQQ